MPTSTTVTVNAGQSLESERDHHEDQSLVPNVDNRESHRIILEPIFDQDRNFEIIDPLIQYREPLHISEEKPVILGRNMTTKIHDTKISRRLASVTVEYVDTDESSAIGTKKKPRVKLLFYQCGALHRFCINGVKLLEEECILNDGDIIGLYGKRYRYKLRVSEANAIKVENDAQMLERGTQESIQQNQDASPEERVSDDGKRSSKRKRSDSVGSSYKDYSADSGCEQIDKGDFMPSADSGVETDVSRESKHQAIISSARKHIIDEVTCTICMEIIVKAHTVNPCGHIFCKQCIQKIVPQVMIGGSIMTKSCPNCRKPMKSLSHLKSMDNMIWNMILRGDIFEEEEDLKEFMCRSEKKWGDLQKEEIECMFGHREVNMQSLKEADEALEQRKKNGQSPNDNDVHEVNVSQNATRTIPPVIVGSIPMVPPRRRFGRFEDSDLFRILLRGNRRGRFIFSDADLPPRSNRSENATVQYEGSGSREDPIVL
jgi:hypothetical protein